MLTPDHPLSILILGLRTDLTDKQHTELGAVMGTEQCPWEVLLSLANLHRVTLLWYLRLQQHDLVRQMPADLSDYLDALLEENRARNGNLLAVLFNLAGGLAIRDGLGMLARQAVAQQAFWWGILWPHARPPALDVVEGLLRDLVAADERGTDRAPDRDANRRG